MNDSIKILDMIVSSVCLIWSALTNRRLLMENRTNGLTMALTALFSTIGLACAWSIWTIWRIKPRYEVIVPHLFGMVGLAVIFEWLNTEWGSHEEHHGQTSD